MKRIILTLLLILNTSCSDDTNSSSALKPLTGLWEVSGYSCADYSDPEDSVRTDLGEFVVYKITDSKLALKAKTHSSINNNGTITITSTCILNLESEINVTESKIENKDFRVTSMDGCDLARADGIEVGSSIGPLTFDYVLTEIENSELEIVNIVDKCPSGAEKTTHLTPSK